MNHITTKLSGVTKRNAQENIKKFGWADMDSFVLVREPHNEHDPNAIRVELAGYFLGYIPRKIAEEYAPLMDKGKLFNARFVRRNEHPQYDTVGLTVEIVECPECKAA